MQLAQLQMLRLGIVENTPLRLPHLSRMAWPFLLRLAHAKANGEIVLRQFVQFSFSDGNATPVGFYWDHIRVRTKAGQGFNSKKA